ncbi:MAG: Unknown protein [uncultured Campylobacterales bacterium]|uniref:Inner membrane protein CreD n=1 Tax=uncultured Campylobacterales bacterium TaxID=352960 RepID=A0A6S6SZ66_9BACT|nr:MAG: Unknown protein [uncultured Campylobacterales bacterium]
MIEKFKNGVSIRLIVIAVLTLMLLIPLGFIKSLVKERQNLQRQSVADITSKWSSDQLIKALILTIPYKKTEYKYTSVKDSSGNITQNKELVEVMSYAHFLPNTLNIKVDLNTSIRYRSIYEASVYESIIDIDGDFLYEDILSLGIDENDFFFDKAFVSLGVKDSRGIKERAYLNFDNKIYSLNSGVKSSNISSIYENSFSTNIKLAKNKNYKFDLKLHLNGSSSMYFLPYGKVTNVILESSWNNPSFNGDFLPNSRVINEDGFKANYKVIDINRDYPQSITNDQIRLWQFNKNNQYRGYDSKPYISSSFGVDFKLAVDHYTKADRSIKYAILFVVLTFLIFFLTEILNKRRIHPFQYILSGLSLILFFVLLISFSEHIGFNNAYIIAALATIFALGSYVRSVLGSKKLTMYFIGVLAFMYVFIFILLQLQSYSLLIGSVMLFIVLSVVMYISRKIDWYKE